MPEPLGVWIGKEEYGGTPTPTRRGPASPPHWSLEAIAATERARDISLGRDGTTVVFIQDRDTSDVWTMDLGDRVPHRLTTGRDPMPYWEDTAPALSPNGSVLVYADQGAVWLVPLAGGPPRKLLDAASPVWLDDRRLVVSLERDDTSRLAVLEIDDPWPRRLAVTHGDLEAYGEEWQATVSPDRSLVAYTFSPRGDLNRSEIRVVEVDTGSVRALSGSSSIHENAPRFAPEGERIAYASELSGWYELHVAAADGSGSHQLTSERADFTGHRWHPDGDRIVAVRGRHGHYDLVLVDASSGRVTDLAAGGTWGEPQWTADGAIVATYEDRTTAPQLRLVRPGSEPEVLHAPTPLSVVRAPHVRPEEVTYRSEGVEIHAFLFRPPAASAANRVPAVVYPHGGPVSAYGDEWDGHAQYFVHKGYAWLAPNYRGSTGYGREFERLLHGRVGIADTRDCLAAADYLRTLDWVDGDRLGVLGASWGSFLALLCVTDDPEYRFKCAVCKYGDCNLLTSWSQGDRGGVLEAQENLMGSPRDALDAYIAGSPVHRLENVRVPILVTHGERDERVHPKQSEELVAELRRLGKTYEYVTYPTEAHGLLRSGPQIDFYRRAERFLDWYLL
jgi:dipeptidyl aminopeptidase/acylaminoacyl peptidase